MTHPFRLLHGLGFAEKNLCFCRILTERLMLCGTWILYRCLFQTDTRFCKAATPLPGLSECDLVSVLEPGSPHATRPGADCIPLHAVSHCSFRGHQPGSCHPNHGAASRMFSPSLLLIIVALPWRWKMPRGFCAEQNPVHHLPSLPGLEEAAGPARVWCCPGNSKLWEEAALSSSCLTERCLSLITCF